MNLVDIYKDLCRNNRWYDAYCSTGENSNGKILYFLNTNYRNLWVFETGYDVFKEIENIGRDQWIHHENHGEEKEKQHTVNMLKSKIFSRASNKYYRNKKGLAFGDMLDSDFSKEERWILIYLTILNGYFANIPNYIDVRSNEIVNFMEKRGVSKEKYISILKNFIDSCDIGTEEIFMNDYLYFDSFYKDFEDIDFLQMFINASDAEKKELKEYVQSRPRNREITKEETCTISYKYKSTGSYVKSTLVDNAKIQYFSLILLNNSYKNYEDFIDYALFRYNETYKNIDIEKIKSFIADHEAVYKLIYEELFDIIQYSLNFRDEKEVNEQDVDLNEKIDNTDMYAVEKYNRVSTVLKKLAKVNSNYRCELEDFYGCQYFTSKESHKNYVEVHHLIPRAVGNDFENSIEVVENYVTLCPHCHRLVHLGEDVERKPALHNLYLKRKELLHEKGLDISEKDLKDYYLIEN